MVDSVYNKVVNPYTKFSTPNIIDTSATKWRLTSPTSASTPPTQPVLKDVFVTTPSIPGTKTRTTNTYFDSQGLGYSVAPELGQSLAKQIKQNYSEQTIPPRLETPINTEKEKSYVLQGIVPKAIRTLSKGLSEGFKFGGSQADIDYVGPLEYTGTLKISSSTQPGTYTTIPVSNIKPLEKFGMKIGTPIGRMWEGITPSYDTGRALASDKPMVAFPALVGSGISLVSSTYVGPEVVAGVEVVRGAVATERALALTKAGELIKTVPFLEKGVTLLEKPWVAETAPKFVQKVGGLVKTIVTQIPEVWALTKIGMKGNVALVPKEYRNDQEFYKEITIARQNTVSGQGLGGALLESAPGINMPYGLIAGTSEKFRNYMIKEMRDKGIYSEAEIQKRADAGVKYIQRMKPIEFAAVVGPSAGIEGSGREAFKDVFTTLAKKGPMTTSQAVAEVIGGTGKTQFVTRLKQNMFMPKGTAFWTTFPRGVIEGLTQDYQSQRLALGPKGFTGVKTTGPIDFLKPVTGYKELTIEEANSLLPEIKGKGIKGTTTIIPSTKTERILNPDGTLNKEKVTQGTINATKYRLDKDGKINYVYVDDTGKVISGSSVNDISTLYDPFRGLLSGTIGGYSSGVMQKGIMSRQIKDISTYFGGEVKPFGGGKLPSATILRLQDAAKSGKFVWKDYSPFYTKPQDIGTVTFGTSTATQGTEMVGLSPSKWRQRLAYLTDWSEKPGDIGQDWFRSIRAGIGRPAAEPTMSWAGNVIPIKTKTSTKAGMALSNLFGAKGTSTGTTGTSGITFNVDEILNTNNIDTSNTNMMVSPEQWSRTKTYTQIMPMTPGQVTETTVFPQMQTPTTQFVIDETGTSVSSTTDTTTKNTVAIPSYVIDNTLINTIKQNLFSDTNIPVDQTGVYTDTNTGTQTETQTTTSIPVSTTTFQKFNLPLALWPSLGGFGGGESGRTSGNVVSGVNVNYLRNFFFEKIGREKPVYSGGMLSRNITPKRVEGRPNYSANLQEALGTNRLIVNNSSPFPKKSPRKVKTKNKRK